MRARTYMRRIFTSMRTSRRNVVRRHHTTFPPFGNRVLLGRPGRTYRRRADYHFNVWRPFRRAHSNLLARVRIFIKKGPRWRSSARFAPLVFLILQHRPPELRRIIIRIFKWGGGARGTGGDRKLHARMWLWSRNQLFARTTKCSLTSRRYRDTATLHPTTCVVLVRQIDQY